MIFDLEIELANIERQPEWIGVQQKIERLQRNRTDLMKKYDKYRNEKILNVIDEIDTDLKLFESILSFWIINYSKMEKLHNSFVEQREEINKGADQLELINDLRTGYKYIFEENEILTDVFIKLAESKGLPIEKMNTFLNDLRHKAKEHYNFLNAKI